jgi:CHAT domain-containing protein
LNGNELFQLSCHALAGGAQTLLISRWNVGDTSTFQASIEFSRATDELSAIDAWLETTDKIKQLPVDVSEASRIHAPNEEGGDRKSDHPFFWSGYLLVDTGWRPDDGAEAPPAQ